MKISKLICLLLALVMVCCTFAACGGDKGGDHGASGERTEDGSWANVNFENKTLKVEVSAAQDEQVTFPAADIYTKGPDTATTDEIQKKVLARNERARTELGIDVQYSTSDLAYNEVLEHVQKYVQGAAEDSPDVLDNDIYGLVRAMMSNMLWNVSDPGTDENGNPVYSYFDLEADGWYTEYMKGASFDPNKLYLLAGDYHIDLIRFAWVLFVNVDLFNETFADTTYGTYEDFCTYILEANDFYYADLETIARVGWKDDGKTKGATDLEDSRIGVCLNNLCPRIFLHGSGLSMVEWSGGSFGKGTPSVVKENSEGANNLALLSGLYTSLFNAEGVHYINSVLDSTTEFFDGNIILTMAELGEMESQEMRGTTFERGIVPFPQYNRQSPGFRTIVHDQAEISCILNNASSFSMSSAYLQYINEESEEVLNEYYEKGLKFKYNESKTTRMMIDFVKDHINTPFESVLTVYVCGTSSVARQLYDIMDSLAKSDSNAFASTYAGVAGSYQAQLETILKDLESLE